MENAPAFAGPFGSTPGFRSTRPSRSTPSFRSERKLNRTFCSTQSFCAKPRASRVIEMARER